MEPIEYRFRFEEEQKWRRHLELEGFVVIKQWLSGQECFDNVNSFWKIMETLSDGHLSQIDPATHILSKNYPPVLHGGMVQYVAHSKPQWDIRVKSRPIFERLWKTKYLKTSFDGFCFMNGERNYRPQEIDSFLHSDQSPLHKGVWSFQGVQTLTDSMQDQGGFVCCPRSHLAHENFFKVRNLQNHKDNWYLVPDKDKRQPPLDNVMKLNTKAGDFILWDSRTFHCNTIPKEPCLRVCAYVCMLPTQAVPENTNQLRQMYCKQRRVSNHHPGNGFKIFPKFPRFVRNSARLEQLVQMIQLPELSPEMQQLV